MLQQILNEMYICPELLEELSEDQKQVLFYKMREEQVRRWKLREEKLDEEDKKKPKKQAGEGRKKVDFLKGKDNREWVWVMGEHPNDKTIEQILEEEAKATAMNLAEVEAENLRLKEEKELKRKLEEQRQRLLKEKEESAAELRRKKEEAELYQSVKEARLAVERMELENKKQEEEKRQRLKEIELVTPLLNDNMDIMIYPSPILNSPFLSEEEKRAKRRSRELANNVKEKRTSEIFTSLQKKRKDFEKQALEGQKEVETNWQEQEKKAKEAEIQMRDNARKARTEYRESLRRSITLMQAAGAFAEGPSEASSKPPVPPKRHKKIASAQAAANRITRPAKPTNHQMIVCWFQKEEKDRAGVFDPTTGNVVNWFHGIINRSECEKILEQQNVGSFLIRVSERVWGYTLSYKGSNRCKHFLIDASETGYQFIGADQTVHETLASLVQFHKDNPITISGQEKLIYPCGQIVNPPNYSQLFKERKE